MKTCTVLSPSQAVSRRVRRASRRSGFTLLELLVVMSIGTLIAAITLGGFTQLGASQKRTTCQTNMTQLYTAARLYQADYEKFPYLDAAETDIDKRGVGLWSLYTFYDPTTVTRVSSALDPLLAGYLKSVRTLHCPQDNADVRTNLTILNGTNFNPDFLSYQTKDPDSNVWTYNPIRTTNKTDIDWNRQLDPRQIISGNKVEVKRPPADDTVVTWCPWHRAAAGSREYDNVLFYDGSVQLIPREQDATPSSLADWYRKPRPAL